jgi:hypothetical protein
VLSCAAQPEVGVVAQHGQVLAAAVRQLARRHLIKLLVLNLF